jgi:hypothetical protein
MIRNFGSQIAKRELGGNWVDRFLHRYPDKLISKWTTGIDNNRHNADLGRKYSLYFDLLREKIDQYHVEARYIYNMDEKGFVKRQGWGESCGIRLWEREAYVLNGARTSPKGEVRESKHAV